MDLQEVKTCLRALLSSTAFSYSLKNLLNDFRNMTGVDMPLFGCLHPVEFLRTLDDTVQLLGNPFDPEIALIESKKSAHIISLVDRQKMSNFKSKYPHIATKQKRLILPNRNQGLNNLKQNKYQDSNLFSCKNNVQLKELSLRPENTFNQQKEKPKFPPSILSINIPNPFSVKEDVELQKPENTSQEKKIHVEETQEVEKTDSCYFEGENSDNESCISIEGSRSSSGRPVYSPCNLVNDGIKNKLRQLIKRYPGGLWCCELPELFFKKYQYVLDYREFGYTSLIQMLSELPDVFRCVRPGNEDWIVFDASIPPSEEEKKMTVLQSTVDANRDVRANLKKLLISHFKNSTDSGIELDKISDLYQKTYGRCLDVQSLGFKDLKSLLESWEEKSLRMLKINGNIFVVPAVKIRSYSPNRSEAVPPITAENDLFLEIFPKDVVGPEERLVELDLYHHVAVGQVVEVCVAEVWSPTKFYLQLNKFKNRLNRFMDDLQKFYNVHLNKYKMPNSTIRPNQVCVGLYSSEPEFPDEWHRAQVVKVINEKTVLINFVDFGTVTRVKKSQLRFLHRRFQYFPVQGFLAELSGVTPPNDEEIWPMSTNRKFLDYLRLPYFKAEIVEVDFKKPSTSVILFDPFQKPMININKKLIEEKLAWEKEPVNDDPFLLTEPDEKILTPTGNDKSQKEPTDKPSSDLQESFIENEFSDITDLGQSTLFYFQMKSLKLDNTQEKKESEQKAKESLSVTFEFEDVPDLEKNADAKENNQNGASEGKKDYSKFVSPLLKNIQNCNPSPPKNTPQLENNTLPAEPELPSKSKTIPPGLEHINVFPPFQQPTLLLMNPENMKKRINILAMDILSKNPSIQQVGMNDPVLALKIATEMAETYIRFEMANPVPYNFNHVMVPSLLTSSLPIQTNASEQRPSDFIDNGMKPVIPFPDVITNKEKSKPSHEKRKTNICVKKRKINGKELHLIVIDNMFYFCADEVVRLFTLISSREIADRLLLIKRVIITYRVLSKSTDGEAIKIIKRCEIPMIKNKSKKLKVYLIPVEEVVKFLQALGCRTDSFGDEFLKLKETEKVEVSSPS